MKPVTKTATIIGYGCRLPGAESPDAFWTALTEGRCTISDAPEGRWSVARFDHPRASEPGFAYTSAGGYLANPFDFDAGAFGISPREAQQMDPQQRLLLEVVWEALEDAGLPPSRLAGTEVGVYVGASNVDYQSTTSLDLAAIESHFMTGNSLSITANRISHVFDWRGPSLTIDTACSSSIVALAQAMSDLDRGVVETAVVAGVNLLLSPAPFIGFSRARMLSPTGRCRPFSADADGYVRSEGAVAIVLHRADGAAPLRTRGTVVAAGVNSDGKTVGISLPSREGQQRLLDRLYAEAGVSPDSLAFVEAHGTGTRVGDPAEAGAIGASLGRARGAPLPVGSAKSNVGHLESASGLVGLLKAVLSLEHRVYPGTLHLERLNPDIDFEALNLSPVTASLALAPEGILHAGICNYGFGGTNAHAIIRSADAPRRPAVDAPPPRLLMLSAACSDGLSALAGRCAEALRSGQVEPAALAAGLAHQRDWLPARAALPLQGATSLATRLSALQARTTDGATLGTAASKSGRLTFVYSGNGSQWEGMGRAGLARSPAFVRHLRAVDAVFMAEAGWSLEARLGAETLGTDLASTSVAQPLIFAIQVALTLALADLGIRPQAVLGHSIGEIAAAWSAGALDLAAAIRLIQVRSRHQEASRGRGRMAVLACGEAAARAIVDEAGAGGLDLAALNGPASTTISGTEADIRAALALARSRRIAGVQLDLDYPFHSRLLDGERSAVMRELRDLGPGAAGIAFVSSVTGVEQAGSDLGPDYWWRNVRDPVRFQPAIERLAAGGADLFVEIGPKPVLASAISDTLGRGGWAGTVVPGFSEADDEGTDDPVLAVAARLAVNGAALERTALFGAEPAAAMALPSYPWQRRRYVLPRTPEALGSLGHPFGAAAPHLLLGYRMAAGSPEWRNLIDAARVPFLADHRVGGEMIVPGAALVDMALAVARTCWPQGPLTLEDLDILQPLVIPPEGMREVSTTLAATGRHVEIRSRPRFGPDEWTSHARVRIGRREGTPSERLPAPRPDAREHGAEDVYRCTSANGVDYGTAFRRILHLRRDGDTTDARLGPAAAGEGDDSPHLLLPTSLDAALHPFFLDWSGPDDRATAHLPVRVGRLTLWVDRPRVRRAVLQRVSEVGRTSVGSITLLDEDDAVVATVERVVFRSLPIGRSRSEQRLATAWLASPYPADAAAPLALAPAPDPAGEAVWKLVLGFALALAFRLGRPALDRPSPLGDRILAHLAANGLAERVGSGWQLAGEGPPHEPETILQAMAALHPEANAELLLCSDALVRLPAGIEGHGTMVPRPLLDQVQTDSARARAATSVLGAWAAAWCSRQGGTPPTILLAPPWNGGLLKALLPLARAGLARLALAGRDARTFEDTMARWGWAPGVTFADCAEEPSGPAAGLILGLSLDGPGPDEDPAVLARRLAPGGTWIEAVAEPDIAVSLLLDGRPGSAEARAAALAAAGLGGATRQSGMVPGWTVLQAQRAAAVDQEASLALVGADASPFASALARELATLALVHDGAADPGLPPLAEPGAPSAPRAVVILAGAGPSAGPVEALRTGMLRLRQALTAAGHAGGSSEVWIVTRGAHGASPDPFAAALWGFGRVAANEYQALDIRRVDIDQAMPAADAARRLLATIRRPGRETEVVLAQDHVAVPRLRRIGDAPARGPAAGERTVLTMPQPGKLAGSRWVLEPRRPPGPFEIEIAVAATGLNFRDVMLGMGLLDEDLLGGGLSEASLGFELAGTVVAAGAETPFRAGDRVMGYAAGAFASHVTVPAAVATPVPASLSLEAAATIPVAFATAWYALVDVARLQEGETVLIHGGAGGVGLAAIQVARACGARIIATAGTPEKRQLVRLMGADRVLDSRSLAFADEIRAGEGGVDVVLNSLSGEAMLAGLRLMKPFGRFVELGKRDYLDNTSIDLRPFLRNVAYHNVDLDHLLAARPRLAARVMAELGEGFADGRFTPLPYRIFAGETAHQAFRLMQGSGHVGKILVRPAREGSTPASRPAPFVAPQGPILIVGGTAGFGFETACWLAARGARTLVLASRRGTVAPGLQGRLAALRDGGITVELRRVDAACETGMRELVDNVVERYGPLEGVVHTAMVLRDGMLEGLGAETVDAVLAPKVAGILALEAAVAGQPLAFFVAYSSAATLVGNPGQGAYVAANAFMEGVVRRRRAAGLPGLAIAWGAIGGAGVLADRDGLAQRLQRATGLAAMPVEEALDHLGDLLAEGGDADPVACVTELAAGEAAGKLPVLRSPAFETLLTGWGKLHRAAPAGDFVRDVAEASPDEALELVLTMLSEEVGAILQLPADRIDRLRPLTEVGMDSLMALELRTQVEKRCRVDLPLVSIAGRSLRDLAERLLADLTRTAAPQGGDDRPSAAVASFDELRRQHTRASLPGEPDEAGRQVDARLQAAGRRRGALL